jgi:hypothetical protein
MPSPDALRVALDEALSECPWNYQGFVASVAGECHQETLDTVMEVVTEWLAQREALDA